MNRVTFWITVVFQLVVISALQAEPPRVRVDLDGDPLPDGALLRFGSVRLRHGASIERSSLSSDGKELITLDQWCVAIWDVETGKPLLLPTKMEYAATVCKSRFDSDEILKWCRFVAVHPLSLTGKIATFDFTNLQLRRRGVPYSDYPPELQDLSADEKSFVSMTKSPRSLLRNAPCISGGQIATIGDAQTGKKRLQFEIVCRQPYLHLCFCPDGKKIMGSDGRIWHAESGRLLHHFPPRGEMESMYDQVRITPDGKSLFCAVKNSIRRFDLTDDAEHAPLRHSHSVNTMHFGANGKKLISITDDGVAHRWDLTTGEEVPTPLGYGYAMSGFSPNGKHVLVAGDGGRIDLWDAQTGKFLRSLRRSGEGMSNFTFTPDGRQVALTLYSGLVELRDLKNGEVLRTIDPRRREHAQITVYEFSADGRKLLLSSDNSLALWDIAAGKAIWQTESRCGWPIACFLIDDKTVISGHTDGVLVVRNASTGQELRRIVPEQIKAPEFDGFDSIRHLHMSPDRKTIALGHSNAGLRIWNPDGRLLHNPWPVGRWHTQTCAFSPDSRWIAVPDGRGIHVVETITGKLVHSLADSTCCESLAFAPDGKTLYSGGQHGAYRWELQPTAAKNGNEDLNDLWRQLADDKPHRAYRALWAMIDHPRTPAYLRERMSLVRQNDAAILRAISQLDSDNYHERDAATKLLDGYSFAAASLLRNASNRSPSPEGRARLEKLLAALEQPPTLEEMRVIRAVQVLELTRTPDAHQVLQTWANGAPGARLTDAAKAAIERLNRAGVR